MKPVPAHVAAAAVLLSSTLVLLASATAYAKENPGNRYGKDNNPGNHYGQLSNPGHHYGQLKHQQIPAPSPSPASNPSSNPASHPSSNGSTTTIVVADSPGLSAGDNITLPDFPINLPAQQQTSSRSILFDSPSANPLDWLLLLILPALLAIWLMTFTRIAVRVSRRRRTMRAVLASAPTV